MKLAAPDDGAVGLHDGIAGARLQHDGIVSGRGLMPVAIEFGVDVDL